MTKKVRKMSMALETIKKLLADYKHIDESLITRETTFESIGIDSLDTVDLLMGLEDELNISVELDEKVETVGDLVRFIEKKQAEEA